MPSSPTPAAGPVSATDLTALLTMLTAVPDPRARRGVRHSLVDLLVIGVEAVLAGAVLAGACSFAAIGQWAGAVAGGPASGHRAGRAPDESTFRRVFARVDADALSAVIGAWLWTRTAVVTDRPGDRHRRQDRARRAAPGPGRPRTWSQPLDHASGSVLGQLTIAAKSNEIPAVRTLLAGFDLTATVLTVDAMHTQRDTAAAIIDGGGDYVFTVKKNQCRPCTPRARTCPGPTCPGHSYTQHGHGRRVTRTIKVIHAPAWVQFTGATQVAQIRRTVTKAGRKSVEVVYVITSADHAAAPPATPAAWVQGHWSIENRLHWVRSPGVSCLSHDVA